MSGSGPFRKHHHLADITVIRNKVVTVLSHGNDCKCTARQMTDDDAGDDLDVVVVDDDDADDVEDDDAGDDVDDVIIMTIMTRKNSLKGPGDRPLICAIGIMM
eukprot:3169213-Amphidinium_carterae.1